MPVTLANQFNSSTDTNTYNIGDVEITSGKVYYFIVINSRSIDPPRTVTSISGGVGPLITWTAQTSVTVATGEASTTARITLLRGAATGTGTISGCTVTMSGAGTGLIAMVFEVDSTETGNNGGDSVLQFTTGSSASPVTSATITIPGAFADGDNGVFAGFAVFAGTGGSAFAAEVGYTELVEETYTAPEVRACAIVIYSNESTPTVDFTSSTWIGFACEMAGVEGPPAESVELACGGGSNVALSIEEAGEYAIAS